MAQKKFSIIPTSECIKYIESFGKKIDTIDFFKTIPSGSGLVYILKNNKVVLIPSDFNANYPGFIFEEEAYLDSMIKNNYFPIGEKFMTTWEIEKVDLDNLPNTVQHFKTFLLHKLGYENKNLKISDLKSLYGLLSAQVNDNKLLLIEKEKILISFGILFADFLVKSKGYTWFFETRYEVYNSYNYPMLQTKSDVKDIIDLVFISLSDNISEFDFLFKLIED